MLAGREAGEISTSSLPANSVRVDGSINRRATARFIVSRSALAYTSTGAPCAICVSSTPEDAKLKFNSTPGCSALKALPTSRIASCRLAAADTGSAAPARQLARAAHS
jgi:hypothetical protein